MSGGLLSAKITADDSEFQAALTRSRAAIKATREQMDAAKKSFMDYGAAGKAVGVALAAAATAAAYFTIKTNLALDALTDVAHQVGGTVAGLQSLQRVGDLAGASTEDLTAAVNGLNNKLGAAVEGSGTAMGALNALGLSAKDLSKMDVDQRLAAIADAIQKSGVSAQQTGAILRDLGIKQASLIPLFQQGGDAIRAARKELDGYGVAISEIDVERIGAANDALKTIELAAKGVATSISISVSPVLQQIGTDFQNAAKDSEGFRKQVQASVDWVMQAAGFIGDAFRGLEIVWETLRGGLQYLKADALNVATAIDRGIANVIDGALSKVNQLIAAANELGGLHIEPFKLANDSDAMQALRKQIEDAYAAAEATDKKIAELAMADLPSNAVAAWYEQAKKASDEFAASAAAAAAAQRGAQNTVSTEDPAASGKRHDAGVDKISSMRSAALGDEEKALAQLQDKYRELNAIVKENPELQQMAAETSAVLLEQYQRQIDTQVAAGKAAHEEWLSQLADRATAIEESTMTEYELLEKKYADEMELLEGALLNDAITRQKYNDIVLAQTRSHEQAVRDMRIKNWDDLKKLNKLSWDAQLSVVSGTLMDMTAALSTKSRTMFEINKAAAASNAAVRIPSMMAGAYDAMVGIPYVGPYLAVAAAAAAGVFGAAQVSAILGTSFGGGGGKGGAANVPSMSTGSVGQAGVSAPPTQPQQAMQVISVEGLGSTDLFSGSMVRELIGKINDATKDGAKLVIN